PIARVKRRIPLWRIWLWPPRRGKSRQDRCVALIVLPSTTDCYASRKCWLTRLSIKGVLNSSKLSGFSFMTANSNNKKAVAHETQQEGVSLRLGSRSVLTIVLLLVLVYLQVILWFGEGSLSEV